MSLIDQFNAYFITPTQGGFIFKPLLSKGKTHFIKKTATVLAIQKLYGVMAMVFIMDVVIALISIYLVMTIEAFQGLVFFWLIMPIIIFSGFFVFLSICQKRIKTLLEETPKARD